MTKKNYIAIAEVLNDTVPDEFQALPFYFDLIDGLCKVFTDDNERFNADKFREATEPVLFNKVL